MRYVVSLRLRQSRKPIFVEGLCVTRLTLVGLLLRLLELWLRCVVVNDHVKNTISTAKGLIVTPCKDNGRLHYFFYSD